MIDAICTEIEIQKDFLENDVVETIYFGGGTPSLLTKIELGQILKTINQFHVVDENAEITLEANPDDLTIEKLKELKSHGINRLSIGIQSFRNEDLIWMNRSHTTQQAKDCVKNAQEIGISNISIDLIYSLPNLSLEDWRKNIEQALNLEVKHISAYCLTVEEKTALQKWVKEKKLIIPDEDLQSDQFEILIDLLDKNEFNQYEISNFSKQNFESRHNSSYWKGKKYLGIGPSAHSFNKIQRFWNVANNTLYIEKIKNHESWFESEVLTPKDQFNELLMTGLRMKKGVNINSLESILPLSKSFDQKLSEFINCNWMEKNGNYISINQHGKFKTDFIISELFY